MKQFGFVFFMSMGLAVLLYGCNQPSKEPKPVAASKIASSTQDAPPPMERQEDSARSVLTRIFTGVMGDDCGMIASDVAFRGIGGEGDYKRACDYSKPDERVTVDKVCAQIKVMLHDAVSTNFEEYSLEEQSEGFWHVWRVRFDYADGNQATGTFGLIEATGHLLLGDID